MPAALHGGSHTRSASTEKLFMRTPMPAADVILLPMEIIIEGTALTPAILQIASEGSVAVMNDAYRERLEQYLASMLQAKQMLSMGILTPKDYATIDTIMTEKYGISSCSLYRGIDLIYGEFRGNMSHYKEVTQCQKE